MPSSPRARCLTENPYLHAETAQSHQRPNSALESQRRTDVQLTLEMMQQGRYPMADQTQAPINLPSPGVHLNFAEAPAEALLDEKESRAQEELKRISLSNEELRELAAKYPPPAEYFEGDEEIPFIPVEE